jgi:hypothetical protein
MADRDEYVPGRWSEVQRVISRAIFRKGRPEIRAMADAMALRIIDGLIGAGYWICRKKHPRVNS